MKKFPDGFIWGASTAAHQVEGDQKNNWSEWEPQVAQQLAESSYERLASVVPNWWKIKEEAEAKDNYISGAAAEHFHRHEDDFKLLNELNLNGYRFSIEWSRVEPTQGKFDEEALNHYREKLKKLHDHGITPIVVLHHFTNPVWFDELGGWHNDKSVELFARYARRVVQEMQDYCHIWLTFNETNSYLLSRYLGGGIWADWPGANIHLLEMGKALKNLVRAHKHSYEAIKVVNDDLKVGIDHGIVIFKPLRRDPLSWLFAKISSYFANDLFPRRIHGSEDVLGIHYYVRMDVKASFSSPRNWVKHFSSSMQTDMGWGVYPRGIYEATQQLKSKNLPIYITENGLADASDSMREEFIYNHLGWLHKSIEDGADIRGYFHWSLFDNFEWSEGYWPKFGLVKVNRETQERTVRDSARRYAEIAKTSALDIPSSDS